MEHSLAKFVRILTPFGFGSLFPQGRTGESKLADHKLLDPPARDTGKPGKTRKDGAYLARLEQLANAGGYGVDLSKLSDAQIRARLLGR